MGIWANQKKTVKIEDVNFVIKKLSLEKQITIASMFQAGKGDEAALGLLQACIDNWDAKDDAGNLVPLDVNHLKNMSIEVANKLSEEIWAFNNLTKDQVKN